MAMSFLFPGEEHLRHSMTLLGLRAGGWVPRVRFPSQESPYSSLCPDKAWICCVCLWTILGAISLWHNLSQGWIAYFLMKPGIFCVDLDYLGQLSPVILWMDEILHHFKTMGNHCLWVFTGESSFQGFLSGAGFRPSTVGPGLSDFRAGRGREPLCCPGRLEVSGCSCRGAQRDSLLRWPPCFFFRLFWFWWLPRPNGPSPKKGSRVFFLPGLLKN